MSELRAPDPTLLNAPSNTIAMELSTGYPPAPLIGHLSWTPCGFTGPVRLWPHQAAYIAVPCRECFPDAPPPGASIRCCGSPECGNGGWYRDPGLSWQVSS